MDPYRDVRVAALHQQRPKQHAEPLGYNAFTGEDNETPAVVAHDPESLAQKKSMWTDHWVDHRHSANWDQRVASETRRLAKQMDDATEV